MLRATICLSFVSTLPLDHALGPKNRPALSHNAWKLPATWRAWPCCRECSATYGFLLFTPLRAFLSYAGAQLGVPGSWVCSWLQYLNFPPCAIKLPKLPAVIGFQYLYFPPSHETLATCNKTWAFILFQYLNFLPAAPQQLLAFIWFHI